MENLRVSSGRGIGGGHGNVSSTKIIYKTDDLFDRLWDSIPPFGSSFQLVEMSGYSAPQFPPADIEFDKDTKDMYFTFALAGYQPDEINVSFDEDYLVLSSEIISKDKNEEKIFFKKGIKKSSFSVKYSVPTTKYDVDNADASFIDGLLKIKIPARDVIKPKQLVVKTK